MFPGLTTKISEGTLATAATILPRTDLVKLTGTTSIAEIQGQFGGGFSGIMIIVPLDGNVATLTTGNIAAAVTMVQNQATILVYSKEEALWYPGAIS